MNTLSKIASVAAPALLVGFGGLLALDAPASADSHDGQAAINHSSRFSLSNQSSRFALSNQASRFTFTTKTPVVPHTTCVKRGDTWVC
jgi:hypothetical protein